MLYTIQVDTNPSENLVTLRLHDAAGKQIGHQQVKLADRAPSLWEGLFDLRRHVDRYATRPFRPPREQNDVADDSRPEGETAAEMLERLGLFVVQARASVAE